MVFEHSVKNYLQKPMARFVDWLCYRAWPLFDSQRHFLTVQFDITNACNLVCEHCYHAHHKNHGALSLEQWIAILDQYENLLKKLRMFPRIVICGGEPLLCPFLFPFLTEVRRRFSDCELYLLTNGTLLTSEKARRIKELEVHLQVSLDGPDVPRHDSIRGQGSFEKTMKGCEILKQEGVSFHHLAVLSHRTAQWIPDFFALARQTGADSMNFTRLIVEGYAKQLTASGKDISLEGLELKAAMTQIVRHSRESGIPTETREALWFLIEEGLGVPNNVGFAAFVIGYKGDFKPSSRISLTLGNVLKEGMEKLFLNHPIMKRLRTNQIEGCGPCRYFDKCRGDRNASFAAHGHFFGIDPGCWLGLEERQKGGESYA